jgi:putative addiction module antidote
MVAVLKIRRMGNSAGVTIPLSALAALNVSEGDVLYLTPAPGGFRVTPYDPQFERQMTAAEEVMKKRRNMLREMAKR